MLIADRARVCWDFKPELDFMNIPPPTHLSDDRAPSPWFKASIDVRRWFKETGRSYKFPPTFFISLVTYLLTALVFCVFQGSFPRSKYSFKVYFPASGQIEESRIADEWEPWIRAVGGSIARRIQPLKSPPSHLHTHTRLYSDGQGTRRRTDARNSTEYASSSWVPYMLFLNGLWKLQF